MPSVPDYSIVIPAYNEAQQLAQTLPAIRAAMCEVQAVGELIVVDNNSTDATASVAERYDARVVFEPVNQIARARNAGGAVARADILIFVDADTTPSAELLRAALEAVAEPGCVGGGARVAFDPPARWAVRRLLGLWNRCSWIIGWPAGCFFFCRKQAFDQVQGFSEAVYASEEIWLARRLKKWGRPKGMKMTILPISVLTSSRKTDDTRRMLGMLVVMLLFPFAVRFRGLCGYWYKRADATPIEKA